MNTAFFEGILLIIKKVQISGKEPEEQVSEYIIVTDRKVTNESHCGLTWKLLLDEFTIDKNPRSHSLLYLIISYTNKEDKYVFSCYRIINCCNSPPDDTPPEIIPPKDLNHETIPSEIDPPIEIPPEIDPPTQPFPPGKYQAQSNPL